MILTFTCARVKPKRLIAQAGRGGLSLPSPIVEATDDKIPTLPSHFGAWRFL
jgi:hypothetical protein